MNPCVKDGYVHFYLSGGVRLHLRMDDVYLPKIHTSQRWGLIESATKRSFDAAWVLNPDEWQIYFTQNQYSGIDYIRLSDQTECRSVDVTLTSDYGEITIYSMHPDILNDSHERALAVCRFIMTGIQPERIVSALNYNLGSFL